MQKQMSCLYMAQSICAMIESCSIMVVWRKFMERNYNRLQRIQKEFAKSEIFSWYESHKKFEGTVWAMICKR